MDARGRTRSGAIAVALAIALAIAWFIVRGRHRSPSGDASDGTAMQTDEHPRTAPNEMDRGPTLPAAATRADASNTGHTPLDHTVRDPALHDDVRARIFAAWREGLAAGSAQSSIDAGRNDPGSPGTLDPSYIRSLVREEFVPLARVCYDQQRERSPDASGRITLEFVILGDEHAGGIVDDVRFEEHDAGGEQPASSPWDETFRTCMRETMRAMVFRAPEGGGRVTVRYPFVLSGEAPER